MNHMEFEDFLEQHGGEVLSFCKYLTNRKEEAEDLCQDTFVKGYELMDRIEDASHAKKFFLSIAVGLWKNRKRKFAWRQRLMEEKVLPCTSGDIELAERQEDPQQQAIQREQREIVRDCVNRLPEKSRMVILLYYTEGFTEKEIAEIMEIPVGTVKSRLYHARKKLQSMLKKRIEFM